jgi:maltose O-acetyltransferase
MLTHARRLRKKVLKRLARNAFFPSVRVRLLRWCGFRIGRDVYINEDFMVVEDLVQRDNVFIGDRVAIAARVTIVTSSHPNRSRIRPFSPVKIAPVHVEDDAWLGLGATILPGVRVGRGAVVGAHSVVTRDVEPFQIVVGVPARPVGQLTPPADFDR